jgi:hypothetical protein
VNDRVIPPNRRPIVIADSHLSAGGAMAHIRANEPEALLREYLRLIRRVRNQQRDRSVALRRTDIDALAEHLGWSDEQVLARLADLMGVTRRQRATMLAVLATGAALITISSPFAPAAAAAGNSDIAHGEPPIVVSAEHLSISRHAPARPAARVAPPDAIVRDAGTGSHASRQAPVLEVQLERDSAPRASALHEFSPIAPSVEPAPASPPAEPAPAVSAAARPPGQAPVAKPDVVVSPPAADVVEPQVAVGQPPVPPAIDDDGNQVAVGQPPVPPATDDDGNQVAVGQPPVPAATDDDGNQVAVGQPPVPPAVDDDGNQVAVGQPPVAPTDG